MYGHALDLQSFYIMADNTYVFTLSHWGTVYGEAKSPNAVTVDWKLSTESVKVSAKTLLDPGGEASVYFELIDRIGCEECRSEAHHNPVTLNPSAPVLITKDDSPSQLSQEIPGIMELVKLPCGCWEKVEVWIAVQHLNDFEKWTRQQIADWLDTLDVTVGW